ncbi:histidine phosphotransferase family protein [Phaeovulum sp.]|uniref:histidine phosphotransferase family protein n=1 Tax=Phaeovulum sp. TaxID=2934796 RepID=UPI0027303F24|nr:histidine phosphotransferase family protein [Phaeovulum sp.]MDP1669589.1 histidine phosphotransferase family protein [Phaeovulum sp.]MDZ4119084.1 histidine phosphotransferase family protein [Phaeovulum sp.]
MADDSAPLPVDLAALVGSRLCHDLISPLGAIGNGVELLMMSSGACASPELQLIGESAAAANAKLKFFRVAFGQAGAEQRLGRPEIVALLADLARGGRLSYDWQAEGDQARREVKLVFLALLCLETALPWGGTIAITSAGGGWTMQASARRSKPDPVLWAHLKGTGGGALAPAQVQFALLAIELARTGRKARWEITETGAAIGF